MVDLVRSVGQILRWARWDVRCTRCTQACFTGRLRVRGPGSGGPGSGVVRGGPGSGVLMFFYVEAIDTTVTLIGQMCHNAVL